MRKPNEVGAIWKKTKDNGEEYLSISLDLEALLELTNGAIEKINISGYANNSDNPRAPAYQLKYYPKGGGGVRPQPVEIPLPLPDDDDNIPF